MVSVPAWRQALRDHGRYQPSSLDEVPGSVADLMAESDRGAALLAATLIEDALESRLADLMTGLSGSNADRKLIFGMDAPISTFSAKIRCAYAFGIIDKRAMDQIDIARDIRNACAHARQPTAFSTEAVSVAVQHLTDDLHLPAERPPDVRDTFVIKCLFLTEYVLDGKWRTTSDDILDLMAEADARHGSEDSGGD